MTETLDNIAYYSEDRVAINSLTVDTYVTTDNLLQDKRGKTVAENLPPQSGNVTGFKSGDILIANIRPYLKKIWYAKHDGGSSSDVLTLRIKEGWDSLFVFYSIFRDEFFEHMMNGSKGTKMPRGDKDQVIEFPVPKFEKLDQQKIAKVLSDLDAKIELNNKINAELEAMAKLIYDYWFVQFDFPHEFKTILTDKKGRRTELVEVKPYKSSGGKMVWNEELKREIPVGWEVDTISSWIDLDKSGDWGKESEEGNYIQRVSCIRGADINGLNGNGEVKAPVRYILEKNSHKILESGDLIIEISGGSPTQSTGRMAFIIDETQDRFEDPLICSNFCKAVTLKEPVSLYNFVFEWKKLYAAGVLFGWEGKTSGIKNLLFESFVTNYQVVKPIETLMKKFYNLIHPMQQNIQKNLKQNQKLAEFRDWLLPMLMNGQVRVSSNHRKLSIASVPEINHQIIDASNEKRKAIAACIILNSEFEERFGMVKFEKLLHLSEYHALKENNLQNYKQHAAGPLDSEFTYNFINEAKTQGMISIQVMGKLQRIKVKDNKKLQNNVKSQLEQEAQEKISTLVKLFLGSNHEKPEIVSTLYAVWNNRIIKNELVNDELIKKDFLDWSEGKIKYKDKLDRELKWMRKEGVVPDGWGDIIDKPKGRTRNEVMLKKDRTVK